MLTKWRIWWTVFSNLLTAKTAHRSAVGYTHGMEEVLQANIFFFITSAAVVVFTTLVCVAIYYVIRILKTVGKIVERIDSGSETIAEDISQLRSYIAEGSLISQIVGLFIKTKRKGRRKAGEED